VPRYRVEGVWEATGTRASLTIIAGSPEAAAEILAKVGAKPARVEPVVEEPTPTHLDYDSGPCAMGEPSSIHAAIRSRLAAAFGEPHQTFGQDFLWGLRAAPHIAPVNILVSGAEEPPTIWVFDPHDQQEGVTYYRVRSEAELGPVVQKIADRVKNAGQSK
jgi:hypothetical protein